MRNKIKAAEVAVAKDKCHHYWIIESAGGRTSKGVCKLCGTEKKFYNSWPYLKVNRQSGQLPEPAEPLDNELDEEQGDS